MSCDVLGPLLAGYADDELDPSERERVEGHLASCSACGQELAELRTVSAAVGEAVPGPSELDWGRFDVELRKALRREPAPLSAPTWQRWLSVAAGLLAAGLIALYVSGRVAEPYVALVDSRLRLPSITHQDPRWKVQPAKALPALAQVEGLDAARAGLPTEAIAVLGSRGLVQVRSTSSLGDLYPERVPPGVPMPLATPDASLLLYGAVASRAALALEREVVVPGVRDLLGLLARELETFERQGRTRSVRLAARRARERIGVSAVLMGVDPRLDGASRQAVDAEVRKIEEAEGKQRSPLLGRELDYRAFTPRGIYGEAEDLLAHARSVRWLSLTGFAADDPAEVRQACLVVMAMARGKLPSGAFGLYGQSRLEAAVEVLYGEPDELTPFDLLRSMRQAIPSSAPQLSVLSAQDVIGDVSARLLLEGDSRGVDQVRSAGARGPRVFVLGNTRSVEARVFTQLTHPEVPQRTEPTSFDLLQLIASGRTRDRARSIVSAMRADALGYDDALTKLEPEAAVWRDVERPLHFRSSLERGRLLALAALLDDEVPPGPQPFLGTEAYRGRLLYCSLAGLNSPAPGEPGGWAPFAKGAIPLVEPLPRFHARLASSAKRLAGVLEILGGAGPAVKAAAKDLRRVERMEQALSWASLDVIAGRPMGLAAEKVLCEYGETLRRLGPPDPRSAEDVFVLRHPDRDDQVLHRVVHRLDRIYVVALDPASGQPRLACGAALAAGEVWSQGQRLTRDALLERTIPDPLWARHLIGGR